MLNESSSSSEHRLQTDEDLKLQVNPVVSNKISPSFILGQQLRRAGKMRGSQMTMETGSSYTGEANNDEEKQY